MDALWLRESARALDAADRALVDLWCAHGLDDRRIAAMSGVRPERLIARRERIARRLALRGLDGELVRGLLASLAEGPAWRAEPRAVAAPPAPTGSPIPAARAVAPSLPAPTGSLIPAARAVAPSLPAPTRPSIPAAGGVASSLPDPGQWPAHSVPIPASTPTRLAVKAQARRRHRRAFGGAIAAVFLALGIAVLASQRSIAAPAGGRAPGARMVQAPRPAPERPLAGSAHPGRSLSAGAPRAFRPATGPSHSEPAQPARAHPAAARRPR